ncbi:MAG: AsmA-like C-terminal domain-containing protein [Kiritimatiellae bacterium]|nr:AsmA-like C-terminal domain-containing protein [Kiritimatiellia bacterium]
MWKLIKFFVFLFKLLLALVFIAVLALAVALYIAERGIPGQWLRRLTEKISNESYSVKVERATFSLKDGFRIIRPSVYIHPGSVASSRFVSAEEINLGVSLDPSLGWTNRITDVTVKGLLLPEIPDQMPKPEKEDQDFELPNLSPFRLTLENPDIFGIRASRLDGVVTVTSRQVELSEAKVAWLNNDCPEGVNGKLLFDALQKQLTINVSGQALPSYIVPIMDAKVLDCPEVALEMNAFQSVRPPVQAAADISVCLTNSDYTLSLRIDDPNPCVYKGVPVQSLKGELTAGMKSRKPYFTIGPLVAKGGEHGELKGKLSYSDHKLTFDADSSLPLPHVFDIIGILNHGELDVVKCDTPPTFVGGGSIATESTNAVQNWINGKVSMGSGNILNLPVRQASAEFVMNAYTARFDRVSGTTRGGGSAKGTVSFRFPDFDPDRCEVLTDLILKDVPIADLAKMSGITNELVGVVSGSLTTSSLVNTNQLGSINGEGKGEMSGGVIAQMPLFAGLTEYLSKHVPGVSFLVDQSNGSMSFTITNGVLRSDSVLVEGSVFSISGSGTYNIPEDRLDFLVRVNIFKKASFLGKITRLVTVPVTKLLLEFKVTGTLQKPEWSYHSVVEKITDMFSTEKTKDKERQ